MHLGQVRAEGATIAAIFEGKLARPIPAHSTLDLIRRSESVGEPLSKLAGELASRHSEEPFQHIGILSLEFHVDKLSRPLL